MLKLSVEFKEKYKNLLGEKAAEKMFAAMNDNSKKAFRINPLKKVKVSYPLNERVPDLSNGYYGEISGNDPEWVSGSVYSQDPSAMFPAHIANVKPGEKVLDLCAAPGGKSTGLGEALKGKGVLVANEISTSRAKILRENIERWGITNALVTNASPDELVPYFKQYFDKILVDAPCSGEGMFRKNPEAIEYWSPNYVETCKLRQQDILTAAIKMLKPGGKIIYSTCTFSPEEDEQIVEWLVKSYSMQILPIENITSTKISYGHPEWGSNNSELTKTLRFWPQDDLGEGQFAALLKLPDSKTETKTGSKKKKKQKKSNFALTNSDKDLIDKVLKRFTLPVPLANWKEEALVRNNHVFIPVINPIEIKGLKILNNGVELGILKKNRFEPGHQLAEVLGQDKQTEVIDLTSEDEFLSYLHGETIQVNSPLKGFVLVSYKDMIFSFGKIAGKTLKNFYPKGLRLLKK
ncbi:RsmB/NOP family class I SAM-dependent RNA methyltransferase [Lactobacillus sp. LL6]|uniref:RsmB/NOP family class I SAM-dependent RNA methyltransferase n=1 Tax=Lactobacillus sp. LL6 TaxID=2596827 RepID=UPI00118574A1|nr:RsmB/NOP family class I SAM-dependent RNA methyltransferase [Lactobacillus sp. LL6]TSO26349.1 RNA methyltransferase [Lactobacillus sp. LL6]